MAPFFQEALLFDDTIANNIRVGRPEAKDPEVEAAARAANIHDEIMRCERGYETRAGSSGSRLSSGERQRIAIARAILRDAPIVVLDEATASPDLENQEAIQTAITALVHDRSVFVIAHDFAPIVSADRILMMEAGATIGTGTHVELLDGCKPYRRLWKRSQLSGEWTM
jgi:ABC-type multidrug transport system fused ATPase/permease subunit